MQSVTKITNSNFDICVTYNCDHIYITSFDNVNCKSYELKIYTGCAALMVAPTP